MYLYRSIQEKDGNAQLNYFQNYKNYAEEKRNGH